MKSIVATMANAVVEAQGGTPIVIEFTDEPLPEGYGELYNERQ